MPVLFYVLLELEMFEMCAAWLVLVIVVARVLAGVGRGPPCV